MNWKELEFSGIDKKKCVSLARRLSRIIKDADNLGIIIFGGSGSLSLRYTYDNYKPPLILVDWICDADGGDGGTDINEDGLTVAEYP